MPRVYVRAPRDTIITYDGEDYYPRTRLPDNATHFTVTQWRDIPEDEQTAGMPPRVAVVLPAAPVGTSEAEIAAMLDAEWESMEEDLDWYQYYPEGE